MKPEPYEFESNDWSQERYDNNWLLNSDKLHDPIGTLGKYKTNDAEEQVASIKKHLSNTRNAIDVGCRWGSFGMALHKIGFQHVHMIEMREYHFKGISYNVDLSRATVYNFAAMNKSGKITRGGKTVINTETGDVPAYAIDDLEVDNVDLIKIDVDGPDRLVLEGCLGTISRCMPVIYIEYGDEQKSWEEKYGKGELKDSKDLWGILEATYKEIPGPENNIILLPIYK